MGLLMRSANRIIKVFSTIKSQHLMLSSSFVQIFVTLMLSIGVPGVDKKHPKHIEKNSIFYS